MNLDPDLLKILACPLCRAELAHCPESAELVCRGCGRRYPIRDGIPDMLVEDR